MNRAPLLLALSIPVVACNGPDQGADAPWASGSTEESAPLDVTARLALRHFEAQRHDLDEHTAVQVRRVNRDPLGLAHVRLAQTYRSIPVLGGEVIVHMNRDGSLAQETLALIEGIDVDPEPSFTAEEAIRRVLKSRRGRVAAAAKPTAEPRIVRLEGRDHLVYQVRLEQGGAGPLPRISEVLVDAHTGEEIDEQEQLHEVALSDEDAVTFDMLHHDYFGDEVVADSSDPVASECYQHVAQTISFFESELGRDGIVGPGVQVQSFVHYGVNVPKALHGVLNGQHLFVFGDGDGVQWGPLVSLDIVAHELGHGVSAEIADFPYTGVPGAINEATSDIFGAATEAFMDGAVTADTWKVGEDARTPAIAGDARRYMNNPTLDGASRDHFSELYVGQEDNGGVHMNSGIANLFFYLLSQGGQHPDPAHRRQFVQGIGIQSATKIWYEALYYMASNTNFNGARNATILACNVLFGGGSSQCTSVVRAWCEVGVGACPPIVLAPVESCCDTGTCLCHGPVVPIDEPISE